MPAHRIAFAAPIAILALVAACAREDAARTESAGAQSVVTITATDYAFEAPDTIAPGFTTLQLVNNGDQLHMAQLIKLEGGKTLDDFLVAYDEAFRTAGPRPSWATRLGGPGAADPRGTSNATQDLEPGSYAWICLMNLPDGIPHVVKARMAKPFAVRARSGEAATQTAPEAGVVIQLVEYAFRTSPSLTPGRHLIRVQNAGAEPHEIALLRVAPGKTTQDVDAWIRNPQGPPPANPVGGVSSLASNAEAYFEVELTSGDYVLLCFVTAPDGKPHTTHG